MNQENGTLARQKIIPRENKMRHKENLLEVGETWLNIDSVADLSLKLCTLCFSMKIFKRTQRRESKLIIFISHHPTSTMTNIYLSCFISPHDERVRADGTGTFKANLNIVSTLMTYIPQYGFWKEIFYIITMLLSSLQNQQIP